VIIMRQGGKLLNAVIGALAAAVLFAAVMGDAAAQTEVQGKTNCTLAINSISFPPLAAGKNAYGMTGNSSFSVNCSNWDAWISTRKGASPNGLTNNGLPFCVTIRANGADASFTADQKRVLWRDGQPNQTGSGNDLTFNFYTNYRDCDGGKKTQAPFCVWGTTGDATDYGTGYPGFMFTDIKGNQIDNSATLNYGAQIDAKQDLFAGTYSNSFIATLWYNSWRYDSSAAGHYNPGNGGMVLPSELCNSTGQHFKGTRSAVATINVTGTVKSSCTAVTPPAVVDLGRVTRMQDIKQYAGQIVAKCSGGIPYQLGISKGNFSSGDPSSGGWRGMGCDTPDTCSNQVIYYNVYKDSGQSQIWGDIGSANSLRSTTAGLTTSVPFYVNVAPEAVQSSLGTSMPPELGTYRDRLIVTLQSQINGKTK